MDIITVNIPYFINEFIKKYKAIRKNIIVLMINSFFNIFSILK